MMGTVIGADVDSFDSCRGCSDRFFLLVLLPSMVHIHGGSSPFAVSEGSGDEDDGGNHLPIGGNHLPIVNCPQCDLPVVKLQSKSTKNLDRWFYKCPNHHVGKSKCARRLFVWEDEYEDYLKKNADGNAGAYSATPPARQPPGLPVWGSGSPMQPSPPGEGSSGVGFQPSPVRGSWSPVQPSPPGDSSSSATFQPCPSRMTSSTTYRSMPSPLRYHENPLDYQPAKLCNCDPRQQAGLFISWDDYPGRRYYCCMRPRAERCSDFLGWADPVLPEHITNLLRYYRDRVDGLELEVDAYRKREKELGGSLADVMKQLRFS